MPCYLRMMDTRIGRKFASPRPTDMLCSSLTTLNTIVAEIVKTAGSQKIGGLGLYAHGDMKQIYEDCSLTCSLRGGYGISLGREKLVRETVEKLAPLKGKFAKGGVLEIFACGAADDGPDDAKLNGNGIELMRAIAFTTGVTVRAADRLQVYMAQSKGAIGNIDVDFGDWEGTVWLFDPETGTRSRDMANTRR